MDEFKKIISKISAAKTIIVAGHINPDGDCLGSLLSLGIALKSLGKRVDMLSADGMPSKYLFLPYAQDVKKTTTLSADVAISVDCNSWHMLGKVAVAFRRAKCIIEIDHHEFRQTFGNMQFIDNKAAAVGEMIYEILKHLNVPITTDIAENILTSILVETDSFRLPNIRANTFDICAQLIRIGVDFYHLVEKLYWTKTRESLILSGICLARCKFLLAGRVVWSYVNKKDLVRIKGKDSDVDAVADKMRTIAGVEAVVLFREKNFKILRVSLRSKHINIAHVAELYDGGGHFDVAGCEIKNTPQMRKELLYSVEKLVSNHR